eukprot:4939493-Prymnesium_polylepis.3
MPLGAKKLTSPKSGSVIGGATHNAAPISSWVGASHGSHPPREDPGGGAHLQACSPSKSSDGITPPRTRAHAEA